MFKLIIDDLSFSIYDWVKMDDLLKVVVVFSYQQLSPHVTFSSTITPVVWIKVIWTSHGGYSCHVNHLVHITHIALCMASEIGQRGGAGAAWVSHVTVRKIVMPDVKEHVRGCHVTDTYSRTLLQEELRHRQLTVTLELSLMQLPTVCCNLPGYCGGEPGTGKRQFVWFSVGFGFSNIDPLLSFDHFKAFI